jgi:hypothetical protein
VPSISDLHLSTKPTAQIFDVSAAARAIQFFATPATCGVIIALSLFIAAMIA